jgi:hypothetical protein
VAQASRGINAIIISMNFVLFGDLEKPTHATALFITLSTSRRFYKFRWII